MTTEQAFQLYDTRLKKVASVFSYKSHGVVEPEEFYQEFAVKLLELIRKYEDRSLKDFSKILNCSLHNLAVNMLRARFKYVDSSDDEENIFTDVIEPSFLYIYKESLLRLVQNKQVREVLSWLLDNPDVVENFRGEKNLVNLRRRRVTFSDITACVSNHFGISRTKSRWYLNSIKLALFETYYREIAI